MEAHPLQIVSPDTLLYNNKDNIIISSSPAPAGAHAREKGKGESGKEQITEWLMDNEEGLTILLRRVGLVNSVLPAHQLREIITPYVDEYYAQIQISGKEDVERRGRSEVKQHFAAWLGKYIKYKQSQQNTQSNNGNTARSNGASGTREGVSYEEFARQFSIGWNSGVAHRGE